MFHKSLVFPYCRKFRLGLNQKYLNMKITDNVEFDTIAREWRMKWSTDNDKSSLSAVQSILDSMKNDIKSIRGFQTVL
jgi:hypothetical protein